MKLAEEGKQISSTKMLISEIERSRNPLEIEKFFTMEEKLLNHLYRLEKEDAQRELKLNMDYVGMYTESQKMDAVECYLISLSSIIARHLEKNHFGAQKAYGFNMACFMFIKVKLNNQNTMEFADELIEFYMQVLENKKQPALRHNTVNKVVLYIDEDVESSATVEEIAKKFNVSTSHLSRIFREHTGTTLVEYINIRKVEEAQFYLRFSDKRISAIADQFNFCNQSYFTRIFKKYTGQTPRRFRSGMNGEYFRFSLPDEKNSQSL
ncbi:AraC family transcriptional regulator [Sporosarcina limicola]|uniref:AraC-like DNA-binding protein n=1 Tax=Sporosarcina limicola TaxID=34101 RepID=A0A927R6N6_9BACL|nr:AraC-like DNA-binding protein [Sporosarcina limicola]